MPLSIRAAVIVCLLAASTVSPAQQSPTVSPSLFSDMRWRAIGPYRGGRTKAAAGHPSQPYTFYVGVCDGGVWKTTDAGRTWTPIFDDQPTGSIGAIAVAPSNPDIVYVGSGEALARPDLSVGDGIYKSTDAGKTWTHLGLRDAQQIANIAVDPKDPNRLFVAAAGHPNGPNPERGIFRSTDGGQNFQRVLFKNEDVGGNDVDIDPVDPNVVYATLWQERQGPWEAVSWRGNGGGIYKSIDGGTTWRQLAKGLPQEGNVTQVNLAIAPSDAKRLYASVATGAPVAIYRSDDAGETWTQATTDARPTGRIGGGDLSVPIVNPKDADTLIAVSTVAYKSSDGARSWTPLKGAPGGDDYQNGWINPVDPNIILLTSDQGAVVSLNGGATWSSWYNQPTAQLYHVNADNDFPYRVCSGQQESGSACVSSRGNDGQITFREWHPVGVEEYGYAVPDPKDPNVIFGGKITRYDRRTAQTSNVSPVGGGRGGAPAAPAAAGAPQYRTVRTLPVAFSPVDPRVLYFANNYLWKTVDAGVHWTRISDDPTRKTFDLPRNIGVYSPQVQPHQVGVIYSIAPSPVDLQRIWIGTDDGVIETTPDGGAHWTNVTPPTMVPFMKVFNIDAGHSDALTAYAAGNTLRLDDMRPHFFRTHDAGKHWAEINTGLDQAGAANSIREDPKKKGLLYAATEKQVFVSFDDGDHWQSLRLNMASSSVRDITIHGDDLIAATHGRGFWILDDLQPLRQIDSASGDKDALLFAPAPAYRLRWNTNTDTPLPPDESGGPNPPEGAIVDYYLKSAASGPVTLEVFQPDGRLVRRYSSADPVTPLPDPATSSLPLYWYRRPQALSAAAGMHRFTWDVHYQPLAGGGGGFGGRGLPIAAVPYNTAPAPATPWVNPGPYTVKLTVNSHTYSQPITVKQDPRVKTPSLVMQQVYSLTKSAYFGAIDAQQASQQVQRVRDQIAARQPQAKGPLVAALADLDRTIATTFAVSSARGNAAAGGALGGGRGGRGGRGGAGPAVATNALTAASNALAAVMNTLQAADVQPTANQSKAIMDALTEARGVMAKWTAIKTVQLPAVNLMLKTAGLDVLTLN